MNALTLNQVSYEYGRAKKPAIQNISATFEAGKVVAIVGKSGAGKTTLLSLISGLDTATKGEILYKGKDLRHLDRDHYRSKGIGVVFQGFNLLTGATALENILLSMNISQHKSKNKKESALKLLQSLGIDLEKSNRKVLKLSGGEQQRIAIARALAHEPDILIADEPTGNLDSDTEAEILEIFKKLAHVDGKCVLIVTHSDKVADIADEIWQMADGTLAKLK